MIKSRKPPNFVWLLAGIWFIGSLILTSISPRETFAQSSDETWTTPVNLSHSGATTNPSIISDSDGNLYVVWQDRFENFIYSQFIDNQWSPPQQSNLNVMFSNLDNPEDTPESPVMLHTGHNPQFVASPSGVIYAVWITASGSLFANRVNNVDFTNVQRWSLPRVISYVAMTYTATVDANGDLHIAYMKRADASHPPGIYYIRTTGNGNAWSGETLIYESAYFTTLIRGGSNLTITTGGTSEAPLVLIAWDNKPRKQLLMSKSHDGGITWDEAGQIAGPSRSMGEGGPFNVRASARGNDVMVVWQSGQPDGVCTQFFGFSADAGVTWSGPDRMIEGQPGCALSNEFVPISVTDLGNELFLLTDIRDQKYLSAWNGKEWSEPQLQPILSGFQDPEIFDQVDIDCLQTIIVSGQLFLAGCDKGRGGEMWVTSRRVDAITPWFSSHVWNQLAPISTDRLNIIGMSMVTTPDGLVHAFFSQPADPAIYYTRWDGTVWSRLSLVVKVPEVEAGWPAVTVGPGNELFLVARSGKGTLFYTRAKSDEALNPSGWSEFELIPTPHVGRLSPVEVGSDISGRISIAYSVPVNDDRGVYLIQSDDQGETWTEPLQVFNGTEAGYESVGQPSLRVSSDGKITILWKQQFIQANGLPQTLSLNMAISEDNGLTFDVKERIVEAQVGWQEIGYDTQGNLHLLYRRTDNTESLWDQISSDDGITWQDPITFPMGDSFTSVMTDPNGGLHLVESSLQALNHWLWDGSRWQAQQSAHWSLTPDQEGQMEQLDTLITENGRMVVVIAATAGEEAPNADNIFFAARSLELEPREIPTEEAAQVLTTPTSTPTEPAPTPISTFANLQNSGEQAGPNNLVTAAMILLPVSFLLISVFGIVTLRTMRGRSR